MFHSDIPMSDTHHKPLPSGSAYDPTTLVTHKPFEVTLLLPEAHESSPFELRVGIEILAKNFPKSTSTLHAFLHHPLALLRHHSIILDFSIDKRNRSIYQRDSDFATIYRLHVPHDSQNDPCVVFDHWTGETYTLAPQATGDATQLRLLFTATLICGIQRGKHRRPESFVVQTKKGTPIAFVRAWDYGSGAKHRWFKGVENQGVNLGMLLVGMAALVVRKGLEGAGRGGLAAVMEEGEELFEKVLHTGSRKRHRVE